MTNHGKVLTGKRVSAARRTAIVLAMALIASLVGFAAATGTSAQTSTSYTYSGTVSTSASHSIADVKVTLVCVHSCEHTAPAADADRPSPFGYQWGDAAGYLAETTVGSDGSWSLTFSAGANANADSSAFINSILALMFWDGNGALATQYMVTKYAYESASDKSGLDAALIAGGKVSGTFTTPPNGGSLPDGDYVLAANDPWVTRVGTDDAKLNLTSSLILDVGADGSFESPAVPPGNYRLLYDSRNASFADDEIWGETFLSGQPTPVTTVITVTAGETTRAGNLELTLSGTISGTVRDADGNPIAGATVIFESWTQDCRFDATANRKCPPGLLHHTDTVHDGFHRVVTTGADGTYSITGLLPDHWRGYWGRAILGESPAGTAWEHIDLAFNSGCVIDSGGDFSCSGRLSRYNRDIPQSGDFTAITMGRDHLCALNGDGDIQCWGSSRTGGTAPDSGPYTAISAGQFYNCAVVTTSGALECWGRSSEISLPDAPSGTTFTAVSSGHAVCALASNGQIYCGDAIDSDIIPPGTGYTAVAASSKLHFTQAVPFVCAIASDQSIVCRGHNRDGETSAPTGRFTAISASSSTENFACAIRVNGSIACWGDNTYGQTNAPSGQFDAIATGHRHACGITTSDTIKCWGYGALEVSLGGSFIGNVGGNPVQLRGGQTATVNWPRPVASNPPPSNPPPSNPPPSNPAPSNPGPNNPGQTNPPPAEPTAEPTADPTAEPTAEPTQEPTTDPAEEPSPGAGGGTGPSEPSPTAAPNPTPAPEEIPQGNPIPRSQVVQRDTLIADQENLLNTYRCLYNIDVEVVPGGCIGTSPAEGRVAPGEFTGTAHERDREIRDRLVQTQENLLNAYRCLFNVDTHLVPNGCPTES